MGFTKNNNMVRVDFFRDTGKWYATNEMVWDRYHSTVNGGFEYLQETFCRCLRQHFGEYYKGMTAVCLEPHHEHSHPVMADKW